MLLVRSAQIFFLLLLVSQDIFCMQHPRASFGAAIPQGFFAVDPNGKQRTCREQDMLSSMAPLVPKSILVRSFCAVRITKGDELIAKIKHADSEREYYLLINRFDKKTVMPFLHPSCLKYQDREFSSWEVEEYRGAYLIATRLFESGKDCCD